MFLMHLSDSHRHCPIVFSSRSIANNTTKFLQYFRCIQVNNTSTKAVKKMLSAVWFISSTLARCHTKALVVYTIVCFYNICQACSRHINNICTCVLSIISDSIKLTCLLGKPNNSWSVYIRASGVLPVNFL